MPAKTKSKTNVSKSAAAQHQCAKAIERAANGESGIKFYSVQKALGNAFFCLRDEKGKDHRGTPRGLFTKGTMLVAVGQIVIAEGDAKGLEIVGVIQKRSDATTLVKSGAMPREILANAVAAGAMMVVAEDSEDDLFETLADEESGNTDGVSGSIADRAKADAMRSVSALAARLGSKSGASAAKVIVESAADATVAAAAEYDTFASPKRVKGKACPPAAAPLSIPMRPGFFPPPEAEATVWDMSPEKHDTFIFKPLAPAPVSWEDEVDIDSI